MLLLCLLLLCLLLQAGRSIEVPVYDFTRHARSEEVRKVSNSLQQQ
jgi:uridine kinase